MFNVKRKSKIPSRLSEHDETPVPKENLPYSVPEVKIHTPPLTPSTESGDISTDEQSVDSAEEPTVEEAHKDEGEDDSSKNEAFDVEICEEETSKDEDYDGEGCDDDDSKVEDCEVEACEDEGYTGEGSKQNGSEEEGPKEEKEEENKGGTSKEEDEVISDHESKDNGSTEEDGSPPDQADVAEDSNNDAPDEDPEEEDEEQIICDIVFVPYRNGYKIYMLWLVFWLVALSGGFISYYFTAHEEIMAARLRKFTPCHIHIKSTPLRISTRIGGGNAEQNLLLMPREKWDDSSYLLAKPSSYIAERVIVMQTDTEGCDTVSTCTKLLRSLKRHEGMFKYNFLLSTDGCIYEALGWQEPSPMYPKTRTMVVAFIGNFETVAPSTMQLSQFQALLEASEELKFLVTDFKIIGRKQTMSPKKLFAYIAGFKKWDNDNSYTDDLRMEVDIKKFPYFDV